MYVLVTIKKKRVNVNISSVSRNYVPHFELTMFNINKVGILISLFLIYDKYPILFVFLKTLDHDCLSILDLSIL